MDLVVASGSSEARSGQKVRVRVRTAIQPYGVCIAVRCFAAESIPYRNRRTDVLTDTHKHIRTICYSRRRIRAHTNTYARYVTNADAYAHTRIYRLFVTVVGMFSVTLAIDVCSN